MRAGRAPQTTEKLAIIALYEARIVLEGAVARAASERRTATDLVRLTGLLKRAAGLSVADPSLLAAINLELHRAIWAAAHNRALVDLLERVNVHLGRYPATTLSHPGRWEAAVQQHAELVEAIAERDPDRAARLAEQHFTEARDIRLAMWEQELGAAPT